MLLKAEPTTPQAGVAQVAPEDVQTRMQNFLAQSDEDAGEDDRPEDGQPEQTEEEPQEQPESQSEPTPEDIPDEERKPEGVDEFEIVWQGQQKKLSRAETIELAQKGFDYTQKTQALAEQAKVVSQSLQQLKTVEVVNGQLMQEAAQVKAIEAQLQRYQNVDWVQLATDDPIEYPKHRAAYDVLVNSYQGAMGQYQNKRAAVENAVQQIQAQRLYQEFQRLPEVIPDWKDTEKMEKGKQDVFKYLTSLGATPEIIGEKMTDAVSVGIAYKAMKYDQLVKGKSEKVKQLQSVPPVTKPNAAQGRGAVKAAEVQKLQDRLRKSGDLKDAAALLLTRL